MLNIIHLGHFPSPYFKKLSENDQNNKTLPKFLCTYNKSHLNAFGFHEWFNGKYLMLLKPPVPRKEKQVMSQLSETEI